MLTLDSKNILRDRLLGEFVAYSPHPSKISDFIQIQSWGRAIPDEFVSDLTSGEDIGIAMVVGRRFENFLYSSVCNNL